MYHDTPRKTQKISHAISASKWAILKLLENRGKSWKISSEIPMKHCQTKIWWNQNIREQLVDFWAGTCSQEHRIILPNIGLPYTQRPSKTHLPGTNLHNHSWSLFLVLAAETFAVRCEKWWSWIRGKYPSAPSASASSLPSASPLVASASPSIADFSPGFTAKKTHKIWQSKYPEIDRNSR